MYDDHVLMVVFLAWVGPDPDPTQKFKKKKNCTNIQKVHTEVYAVKLYSLNYTAASCWWTYPALRGPRNAHYCWGRDRKHEGRRNYKASLCLLYTDTLDREFCFWSSCILLFIYLLRHFFELSPGRTRTRNVTSYALISAKAGGGERAVAKYTEPSDDTQYYSSTHFYIK